MPTATARETCTCPITQEARKRLDRSGYAPVRRIDCAFDSGVLTLEGRLHSYFHKQLAQEAVAQLPGVRQVRNRIEVVHSAA